MPLHYLQGDLPFIQLDTRPAVNLVQRPGSVIAVGLATGLTHRLTAGTIEDAPDGTRALDLPYAARVAHEKHDPITLDPGLWLVVRQREYSPAAIRTVLD